MKTSIEGLIYHFKIFTEGFAPPPGEVYQAIESPRGELGVFMASDGSAKPYRVKFRTPSFVNLQSLPKALRRPSDRRCGRLHRHDRHGARRSGRARYWRPENRTMQLPPPLETKFKELAGRYPIKRSALIPMMLYAQDQLGP